MKLKLRAALIDAPDAEWPIELMRTQRQMNDCPTRVLGGISPHHALYGAANPHRVLPTSPEFKALMTLTWVEEEGEFPM